MHVVDKAGQHRHSSPGNQNASNPDAGADFVQQQVARNSKEQVAEKEDPGEQTELLARDRQFLVHRQRRKPNVDPVEKADDVQQENKGDNPDPYFPNRSGLDEARSDWLSAGHANLVVNSTRSKDSLNRYRTREFRRPLRGFRPRIINSSTQAST